MLSSPFALTCTTDEPWCMVLMLLILSSMREVGWPREKVLLCTSLSTRVKEMVQNLNSQIIAAIVPTTNSSCYDHNSIQSYDIVSISKLILLLAPRKYFIKSLLTTSTVSLTNLGSILIFASCVLHRSPVFGNFHESEPDIIRGHCITLSIYQMQQHPLRKNRIDHRTLRGTNIFIFKCYCRPKQGSRRWEDCEECCRAPKMSVPLVLLRGTVVSSVFRRWS